MLDYRCGPLIQGKKCQRNCRTTNICAENLRAVRIKCLSGLSFLEIRRVRPFSEKLLVSEAKNIEICLVLWYKKINVTSSFKSINKKLRSAQLKTKIENSDSRQLGVLVISSVHPAYSKPLRKMTRQHLGRYITVETVKTFFRTKDKNLEQ